MIHLTPTQVLWLETRGGRNRNDVYEENGELCVAMWDGVRSKEVSVPIPSRPKMFRTEDGYIRERE